MSVQLDFFDTDLDLAHKEYKLVFDRVENVRKGIFKRHNDLAKMYIELKQEIEHLKHEIVRLKKENLNPIHHNDIISNVHLVDQFFSIG